MYNVFEFLARVRTCIAEPCPISITRQGGEIGIHAVFRRLCS